MEMGAITTSEKRLPTISALQVVLVAMRFAAAMVAARTVSFQNQWAESSSVPTMWTFPLRLSNWRRCVPVGIAAVWTTLVADARSASDQEVKL